MHRPILALAPNGAYKQKKDHPALPINKQEITRTARLAVRASITLLHLHIRDDDARHSLDAATYLRTIDAIKHEVGQQLIIQITSEAANIFSPAQQIKTIKQVKPECVSIALRELAPENMPLIAAQDLFHWCAEHHCHAQYILYSEHDLQRYLDFIAQKIIPAAPHSVLFVLGRHANNQSSSPEDLAHFLKTFLPNEKTRHVPWMLCAFGASEQACLLSAADQGGHCRIGFENNLLTSAGKLAENNIAQAQDLHTALIKNNMPPASIAEAREVLQIV